MSASVALVAPLCEPLQAMLGAPAPSSLTVSGELEQLLRGIDTAAGTLARKLTAAECRPAVKPPARFERVTQEQCRAARRAKLAFDWPAEFSLPGEIEAICQPIAAAAALANPTHLAGPVNTLAGAVHECITEVADMVTRVDAARRCAGVPIDQRGVARRMVLDLAPRPPQRPTLTAAQLAAGTWVAPLVKLAEPYREGLRELLHEAPRINGEPLIEKFEAALRVIDSAALSAERAIEKLVRRRRSQPAVAAPAATPPRDKALAELARLGVAPP